MIQAKKNPGVAGRGHHQMHNQTLIASRVYIIQTASAIITLPLPLYALDGIVIAMHRGGLQ